MSLLEVTKFLLRQYRIFPKKSLGQNLIVDPSIFQSMAVYASLNQSDVVLDIGAGLGFLTRFLAERCKRVLAVELDSRFVKVLREHLKDMSNVEIIEGNVLKVQVRQFNKVVSIPPYNISSSLLSWLFNKNFDCAALIMQKEFAKRLVASIGSEDYGWLTVVTYYYFEVELFDDVPKQLFYPQPKVDSIIVRLEPRGSPPFALKDEKFFQQFVQKLFTQRNKKVRNAVLPFIKSARWILESAVKTADSLPFNDRRVRELAPEDFGELADAIRK